jgi:hypothetical protein
MLKILGVTLSLLYPTRGEQDVLSLAILRYIFGRNFCTGLSYEVLLLFSKICMSSVCVLYEMQLIECSW